MCFFKTSEDVKINYHLYGKGQPIVLVCGFGGYQEIWTDQVEYLVKMGYQVLTFDHRNMGQSEHTIHGHTLQKLTDDLVELCQYLKISRAVFIGHSMGGSVLYDLIETRPDLVALAIIVDQSPYMLNTDDWTYGFMNYTSANFLTETLKKPVVNETLHGIDFKVLKKIINVKIAHPFNRQANIDLLQEHVQLDWRGLTKATNKKLIVVAAKKSPYYNYQFSKWMSQQNSKIDHVIVDNCGHDIKAEVPDRFNQLLRHFLLKNRYLPN